MQDDFLSLFETSYNFDENYMLIGIIEGFFFFQNLDEEIKKEWNALNCYSNFYQMATKKRANVIVNRYSILGKYLFDLIDESTTGFTCEQIFNAINVAYLKKDNNMLYELSMLFLNFIHLKNDSNLNKENIINYITNCENYIELIRKSSDKYLDSICLSREFVVYKSKDDLDKRLCKYQKVKKLPSSMSLFF